MAIRFWPDGAPSVGMCPCGGQLRLVEDLGPALPLEAQCETCTELTGVSHDVAKAATTVQPGSPADLGF